MKVLNYNCFFAVKSYLTIIYCCFFQFQCYLLKGITIAVCQDTVWLILIYINKKQKIDVCTERANVRYWSVKVFNLFNNNAYD